jgi:hypothetical protein
MNQHDNSFEDILKIYQQQISSHLSTIQQLRRKKRMISIGRLATVLTGLAFSIYLWPKTQVVVLTSIAFLIVLIALVFRDADASVAIKNLELLIKVNQHDIDAIEHVFFGYENNLSGYDSGGQFADPDHPYASDLDLFGQSSLFQWMNRCHADQSKKMLSVFLKEPLPLSVITNKQIASRELSGKQSYCQQFQATAMAEPLTHQTEKKLESWMQSPSVGFDNPFWKWFQFIYPVFPISLCTIYILDIISANIFLFSLVILSLIHFFAGRKISGEFMMLVKIEPEIHMMSKQLQYIEKENFSSVFLQSLQNQLKPDGYNSASASIKDLNNILKKIEWRSNLIVNALLQLFLFWDLRLILQLKEWKKKNNGRPKTWIQVIAETEVIISLASMVYNNPGWSFPEVDEKFFHYQAEKIGHPLIPTSQRIDNDFSLNGTGTVTLITGSNMAGKSTFLRSLGINTVLACMGAPVCARRMNLSRVSLISSMRVADNLTENTSTFYAELKKIQSIINAVNRNEPVFILLDEVLRGTNSNDRHKGTQALVRQLLKSGAVAVMATHDTDLAHSESSNSSVHNYHFEGSILGDELSFDYKIKNGICESLNATTLMKKIGIHFQD